MNPQKRREIFERFRAANPHPTTELEFESPFELLLAVILSAQATDKSVNAATRKLFPIARTPEAIASLGVDGLEKYIRTIGLWKAKARNVVATATANAPVFGSCATMDQVMRISLRGCGQSEFSIPHRPVWPMLVP